MKPTYRSSTAFAARLQRFAKRAGSPSGVLKDGIEEAFVRLWSSERVRSLASPLIPLRLPKKWVFLVGCYNSGTTLLQKSLGSHPEISGLPREGVRFTDVLSNLEANGHHMIWDENYRDLIEPDCPEEEAYRRIAQDWSIFWKRGASIFLDKSVANTARIAWLNMAFPNASFVGVYRNGYCIAEGLQRRAQPPLWLQAQTGLSTYSIERIAWQWVSANQDMLDGFKKVDRSLLVRFEDLVANPANVFESIFRFIDVDPGVIEKKRGGVAIGGKYFAVHDPNPASLARLSDQQKQMLKPLIGPMMQRLGYEEDRQAEIK